MIIQCELCHLTVNIGICEEQDSGVMETSFIPVCMATSPTCVTRRCLSKKLIDQDIISQPQTENCTVDVFLKHVVYQTVDVVSVIHTYIFVTHICLLPFNGTSAVGC